MAVADIELERLDQWIGDRLIGFGTAPLEAERVRGGASNVIYRLHRGPNCWLLRRPPDIKISESAHDMAREYRLLQALDRTAVPHPVPHLFCPDESVVGRQFIIMEWIDGFSPRDPLAAPYATDLEARPQLAWDLVDALAEIANADWRTAGLSNFGRPAGFLDRQVTRWMGQLSKYRTRELRYVDDLASWLTEHQPETPRLGLVHGDYQFVNVMYSNTAPHRLVAVVDWEQATIGDPLIDLGWVLGLWTDPDDSEPRIGTYLSDWRGFPTRSELAGRYAERTRLPIERLDYYEGLAMLKLACILEGHYARDIRRGVEPENASCYRLVPHLLSVGWAAATQAAI